MKIREFVDRFLRVYICGGCEEILPYESISSAFCPKCLLRWRAAKTESCPECFRPAMECTCMPKGLSASGALCLRKSVFYRAERRGEPQNRILYYLKHHPNRRMAHFLAEELVGALSAEAEVLGWKSSEEENRTDFVLVGVPRGWGARRVEGFDQSALIAEELSALTGIDSVMAIRRRFGGKAQKKLSAAKRFRNMEKRFAVRDADAVAGKCVFLLDDIVTTGASMAACVKLLRKAGASEVVCLCVAQSRALPSVRREKTKKGGKRRK